MVEQSGDGAWNIELRLEENHHYTRTTVRKLQDKSETLVSHWILMSCRPHRVTPGQWSKKTQTLPKEAKTNLLQTGVEHITKEGVRYKVHKDVYSLKVHKGSKLSRKPGPGLLCSNSQRLEPALPLSLAAPVPMNHYSATGIFQTGPVGSQFNWTHQMTLHRKSMKRKLKKRKEKTTGVSS